mmetsp:Transcript_27935/g.66295  ORF Transcript_27935/g.66295 Transcript_27935/m.66295 type:complete len:677 (-) Transcript_27935:2458-4488(-)
MHYRRTWKAALGCKIHTFNAILALLVHLLQLLKVVLGGVPVALGVGFQEGLHHVPEGIRVGLQHLVLDLLILDVGRVAVFVHEVINRVSSGTPAEGEPHTLRDLSDALIAALEVRLVELGVQQLGAAVQAHLGRERSDLRVGGGGVRDQGRRLLAVLAQVGHDLRRVVVEVVRHVRQRDLAAVQVLEGHVHLLQGGLEEAGGLLQLPGRVGAQGEALARDELLLELVLVHFCAILDGDTHVRRVGSRCVGENPRGRLPQGDVQLLGLLHGVLSHKVHLQRLIRLRSFLDGTVQEVHLVDEQVSEDTRAVAHHIDAGPAQLLQGDQLHLVHAAQGVWHRAGAHQGQHLCQALSVGLDVVRAPEREGDRLRQLAPLLLLQGVQQPLHDHQGHIASRLGGDGVGIQGVHVLASRQHVGVADGVTPWAWLNEIAIQRLNEAGHLVVADHLPQAHLKILEEWLQLVVGAVEANLLQGFLVGGAAHEEVEDVPERVHLRHTALLVGGLRHQRPHGLPRGLGDLLDQGHVLQVALVVAFVDRLDVLALGFCDDARQAPDAHLRAVQLRDVHQGGHRLRRCGRHPDLVEAHRQGTTLDLHEQAIDLAHHVISLLHGHLGHIILLAGQVVDVLIQVALPRCGNDAVHDGGASLLVLPQALVGLHQIAQLLQALVKSGILRWRGQV